VTEVTDRPADAGAGDDSAAERDRRIEGLRAKYRSLQEIDARQRAIVDELAAIDAIDDPDGGDFIWQGSLIREHDDLEKMAEKPRKRAKDLERVRAAHEDPANREETVPRTPDLQTRNVAGKDPFRELERVERGLVDPEEVRGRSLDAIEMYARRGDMAHDYAENATRLAQDQFYGKSNVARHILETGSPDYYDAFRAYLSDPGKYSARAALTLTSANGGYLLPFVLDPTIILTNAGSANPWRRISNIKQTTSSTWNGVNSAGVTAAWLSEGGTAADASPTVANVVVTPDKAAAWVYGSYEVLEDTDFGQQLPRLLADAKDRLEEAAFATNTTAGIPVGIVPAATTVVTTATTLVVAQADIYATQAALPPRFRNAPGCAWVANVAQINRVRQLDTAGGASFWTNLGKGQPETLIGAPIYESTTMDSALAVGTLLMVFGDFAQFIIVDRVGVSMIYEPLVKGSGSPLPSGQAGWFMFWRVGSNLTSVNAFRVMKGK
jgi:HK97 family phage major capsid protein